MKKVERQHLDRVAGLGCVVCRNNDLGESPASIHHCIGHHFKGLSQRASHYETIPLCHAHHQGEFGIHAIGMRVWEDQYGSQVDLLSQVLSEVGYAQSD